MTALERALEALRREGYEVLNDLHVGPTDVSNCVIGPNGVFAIEQDEDAIEVKDEAQRVQRLLRAAGVCEEVEPVVADTTSHVLDAVHDHEPHLHEDEVARICCVLSLYRQNRRSA
jgi:hypothetical protein